MDGDEAHDGRGRGTIRGAIGMLVKLLTLTIIDESVAESSRTACRLDACYFPLQLRPHALGPSAPS